MTEDKENIISPTSFRLPKRILKPFRVRCKDLEVQQSDIVATLLEAWLSQDQSSSTEPRNEPSEKQLHAPDANVNFGEQKSKAAPLPPAVAEWMEDLQIAVQVQNPDWKDMLKSIRYQLSLAANVARSEGKTADISDEKQGKKRKR